MADLTAEAAARLAGVTRSGFQTLANRARGEGVELRAPRERWPDGRTPVYVAETLAAYLAARPGRGHRPAVPAGELDQAPPVVHVPGQLALGFDQRSEPNDGQ